MTEAVLNRAHLARYTAGDAALEKELFALFETQIETCLAKLETAQDAQTWTEAAHTLKGAARGLGAEALGEACAAAEHQPLNAAALKSVREAAEAARAAIRED